MTRWLALALALAAGIATATAFGGAAQPPQVPTLPCLPTTCPTGTTTGQTTPPSTTPQNPPPDPNSPAVGDGPAPHHPAHKQHNGTKVEVLSDERTYTTWATYRSAGAVTSKPFGRG